MIALDFQPYSVVENRGFKELLHVLEPKYQIPSRTTFSRKILPDMYNKLVRSVKGTMETDLLSGSRCPAPAFTFTTDMWTSRAMDPYISFTLSYITDQFQLKTFALENKYFPGSHTAERILETLEKTMDEWSLPSQIPIFCVRDNGSNLKAAIRHSVWYDVACFAHSLQLAIADAIRCVEGMENMLKKCKQIVSHYHHSSVAGGRIDNFRQQSNLPQYEFVMSCPTRWNSEFAMVDRLLVLKAAVCSDIASTGDVENLTTSDWKMAEGFVSVCRPLAEATCDSSGETYPTRSMVIPILYGIFDKLHNFISTPGSKGFGVTFARKLVAALENRFPTFKTAIPDCVCTYLDPRFKCLLFDEEALAVIQKQLEEFAPLIISNVPTTSSSLSAISAVNSTTVAGANATSSGDIQQGQQESSSSPQTASVMNTVSAPNSATSANHTDSLWVSIDQLSQRSRDGRRPIWSVAAMLQEMELYNEEPPIERNSCPLQWWAANGTRFKTLSLLARAFLCIPATQTKSERLNSTSGHIVEDRRTRLLTQHVTELTFLHENL